MTTYRAVVKVALDDPPEKVKRELREGLGMIVMELVAEHDYDVEQIENALADAQAEGELELEMKRVREENEQN